MSRGPSTALPGLSGASWTWPFELTVRVSRERRCETTRAGTLASQFDFVNLVVTPLDDDTYQVAMLKKAGLPDFTSLTEPKVLSERSAATFVRQVALLANHMAILHVRDAMLWQHAAGGGAGELYFIFFWGGV